MSIDLIFPADKIKEIQVTELSAISGMTLEEIATRCSNYERVSRELALRSAKCQEELHRRLSEKTLEELEGIDVHKVPAAEGYVRRKTNPQVKAPTKTEKVQTKLRMAKKAVDVTSQAALAFLDSIKSK